MAKHLSFWGIALLVFVLDRISKFFVVSYIPLNSSIDLKLFSLTHVLNTGTLFGLLKNASWFFVIFTVAVIVFLILKYKTFSSDLQPVLGLILGGAFGNLFDRLVYGAVIDFIDFHFWPAFNMADSAISIAVVWLLVREFVHKKRKV
ncbi:signal peptidase II [Candidatus Woesearchaeota archaeon]|nr:signal peptidase II [Candidatus Woesearchaeota archaeon]